MKKILIFVDHFLPGNKFGGPVRTIANLIAHLNSNYNFFVFTANHDWGEATPYGNIQSGVWLSNDSGANICYSDNNSLAEIRLRVAQVQPSLIYLNSFFSRVTMRILIGRRLGLFRGIPVLLAPRGEFAPAALALKKKRKAAYHVAVAAFGLLSGVTLQASSELEQSDIESKLNKKNRHIKARVLVASDLPPLGKAASKQGKRSPKKAGVLRVIFLARISRNKNLHGALQILGTLESQIEFTICGPIGDTAYWEECQNIIAAMPKNVAIKILGNVEHEVALDLLLQNDLMFLPTQGENYGHAIIEALAVGCPVLISDRTPWQNLEREQVGADLPLSEPARFKQVLERFVRMGEDDFSHYSRRARVYAENTVANPKVIEQNIGLLECLLKSSRIST